MDSISNFVLQIRTYLVQLEGQKNKHEVYTYFIKECKAFSLTEDGFYRQIFTVAYKSIDWQYIEASRKRKLQTRKKLESELSEPESKISSVPRYIERLVKTSFEGSMVLASDLRKIFEKAKNLALDTEALAEKIDAFFDENKYKAFPKADFDAPTLQDTLLSTNWYNEPHYLKMTTPEKNQGKAFSWKIPLLLGSVVILIIGIAAYFVLSKNKHYEIGSYKCHSKKGYFYNSPDFKSKSDIYLTAEDRIDIEKLSSDSLFGYGVFSDTQSEQKKGWLIMDGLDFIPNHMPPPPNHPAKDTVIAPPNETYPKSYANLPLNGAEFNAVVFKMDSETRGKFEVVNNAANIQNNAFIANLLRSSSPFFLVNACISDATGNSIGYLVKNHTKIKSANLNDGNGNFYLKPNGALLFTDDDVVLCESPQINNYANVRVGVQSGPMLLSNGVVNTQFGQSSSNRNIRCGVGIFSDSKGAKFLVFGISNTPVSFYEFALFFNDKFKCSHALCLESVGCAMYFPNQNSSKLNYNGVINNYLYLKL